MDLDLRRARYFQAVAKELHFGRAAHELHIAQPALSRQIAALERELQVRLLERTTQQVSLTPAGVKFLDDITPVIAAADEAVRRARQSDRGTDTLVVGFMPGLSLRHAMRSMQVEFPEVTVELRELTWVNQAESVRDGTVDIVLGRRPIDLAGLRVQHVTHDPRGVLLPADHPLAIEASIPIGRVSDLPVIRHRHGGAWDNYWTVNPRPDGAEIIPGPMVETISEKLAVVASGEAVTFVPRSASRAYNDPDVVWISISDIEDSQVILAWLPERRHGLMSAFIDAVTAGPADVVGLPLRRGYATKPSLAKLA